MKMAGRVAINLHTNAYTLLFHTTARLAATDLESECDIQFYRAGGPGGQHQNKVETAVRLTHRSCCSLHASGQRCLLNVTKSSYILNSKDTVG